MTKEIFGSRERLCALQLLLKMWWWQYILMATLWWRRLWSCLIVNFGALPTTYQEVGVICQPTLLKFLGDVMSVKPRRQGVASKPTHVNLLLFGSIPSDPLQLTFVNCLSVCRSPLQKKWIISWSSSAVKPGTYWQSLVKKSDWTVRVLLLFFLDRCVHMFQLPKDFICDNASIINSESLKNLFAMSGVEQHSSVAYQPQSSGRAERAVQSIVN